MRKIIPVLLAVVVCAFASDVSARFISTDPVPPNPKNGNNFNRYAYVDNNPYRYTDPDGRAKACANKGCTITADTYSAAKSNGQTALASPSMRAAANAAVPQFTVKSGSEESLGFIMSGTNGEMTAQSAQGVQTTSSGAGATAATAIVQGAVGVIHGHIDGGPHMSDGMVDAPELNGGYGDTQPLKAGLPTATVSHGQVGWHEINNGQLQFSYPEGAMSSDQEGKIQNNLNNEQKLFQEP